MRLLPLFLSDVYQVHNLSQYANMNTATTSSSMTSSTNTLQSAMDVALATNKFYLRDDMWWNFIQEVPTPIGNKKRANKQIHRDGQSYKKIYDLCSEMYTLFRKDHCVFAYLPTKKSDVIKKLGEAILNNHFQVTRADMNNISDSTMIPFMKQAPNHVTKFYVLSQRDMVRWALNKWSTTSNERQQRTTDNDRLRVFGILFLEDLREHIPLVTGTHSSAMSRSQLDAKNSTVKGVLQDVLIKFNDMDVEVCHPAAWSKSDTVSRIGSEVHATMNPNEMERILVPRTMDGIKSIISSTTKAYNNVMKNYTKRTGGGDGNVANFSNWQQRDPLTFRNYENYTKSSYLTWIHMWNKQFDHPMVKVNEQLPPSARIEDDSTPNKPGNTSTSKLLEALQKASADRQKQSSERLDAIKSLYSDMLGEKHNDVLFDKTAVLGDLKGCSDSKLDQARTCLIQELGEFVTKKISVTKMIGESKSQMESCRDRRDKAGFLEHKKE